MANYKTVVTWDHVQSEEQLNLGRVKAFEMSEQGLTDGVVVRTSAPGASLTVKERYWVSEEAANQWVQWVVTLPTPPVSAVVVVE